MVENSSVSRNVVSSCISVISFSSSVLVCFKDFSFSRLGEMDAVGEIDPISLLLEELFLPPVVFTGGVLWGEEFVAVLSPEALWLASFLLSSSVPHTCLRSSNSITRRHASRALSIMTKRRQFSKIAFKSSELAHISASLKPKIEF